MTVIYCDQCGEEYDAVACRWRCPLCGWKGHCCEGEPQRGEPAIPEPPQE